MDTLPIKLNFFKRAEQFLELLRLDDQYNLQLKKYDPEEWRRKIPDNDIGNQAGDINLPTWNIEKKILYWSYLNHKHLKSPIKTEHLKGEDFRKDIRANKEETAFAGSEHVLKNLVAHGFAKEENGGAVLNAEGLLVGSLLSDAYCFRKKQFMYKGKLELEYLNLVPLKIKK
ncbi:hypothetical protein COY23_00115 [bacterium (Candidatus Torokbacteria) CG_4_10_14_0_2_um_filter_35_8]|uniref:Uncharacterized protein n=1 Tax=Candidatus Sherwoodlollariibacterium unditelluris TaxID=1974757 RepID=A0A2G9YIQ0_9BACT|nr:MAG: hypothetical protein COX41_04575 [Candidatus Omnitrophica bacterium CG23_combo_of_CG06-09_8_20_14_all_41_10]PIZ58897.1 MAG: hypothetical protein COY23_00115 [bacterium (Candidatus Torokbacteria) CG_4_10_14_0_2_um_filter_35_8]